MIPAASRKTRRAFTLVELLVVVAIGVIFFMLLLPAGTGNKEPAKQIQCMSNLRQIGIGFWLYSGDHSNQLPWQVSSSVSQESAPTTIAADYFTPLTNYIKVTRLFVCPTDRSRQAATNITNFSNSNLSYFISLDVSLKSSPSLASTILAGDRHLSLHKQAVKAGLIETTNFAALGWTTELHNNTKNSRGVLVFADGHAEVVKTDKLAEVLQRQSIATNRLVIP